CCGESDPATGSVGCAVVGRRGDLLGQYHLAPLLLQESFGEAWLAQPPHDLGPDTPGVRVVDHLGLAAGEFGEDAVCDRADGGGVDPVGGDVAEDVEHVVERLGEGARVCGEQDAGAASGEVAGAVDGDDGFAGAGSAGDSYRTGVAVAVGD